MSDLIERLNSKQAEIKKMLNEETRRQGQLDQVKKSLLEEFGVEDLDSAKTKLLEIEGDIQNDEQELEKLEKEMSLIIEKAKGNKDVDNL